MQDPTQLIQDLRLKLEALAHRLQFATRTEEELRAELAATKAELALYKAGAPPNGAAVPASPLVEGGGQDETSSSSDDEATSLESSSDQEEDLIFCDECEHPFQPNQVLDCLECDANFCMRCAPVKLELCSTCDRRGCENSCLNGSCCPKCDEFFCHHACARACARCNAVDYACDCAESFLVRCAACNDPVCEENPSCSVKVFGSSLCLPCRAGQSPPPPVSKVSAKATTRPPAVATDSSVSSSPPRPKRKLPWPGVLSSKKPPTLSKKPLV